MKKYIYQLFIILFASAFMASCSEDEGKEPGNDPNPAITIYKYSVSRPLNPDNNIILRFATNNRTIDAYYLVDKTVDKESRINSLGEDGYKDYVVSNGIKINEASGESNVDVTITDLYGDFTITAVAVGSNSKSSAETTFVGLDWTDVAAGTYHFASKATSGTASANISGVASNPTVLQICTTDNQLYRFKDVFGSGYDLKISLLDLTGEKADGKYTFFRVPATDTPYTFSTYGIVNVRDIGYWQGSDAWVTDNGYESGMYEDYSCFVFIQYYVSAGNIGYGYDMFVPD